MVGVIGAIGVEVAVVESEVVVGVVEVEVEVEMLELDVVVGVIEREVFTGSGELDVVVVVVKAGGVTAAKQMVNYDQEGMNITQN